MRDLRKTDRVSGWRRSKQTYKRERSGAATLCQSTDGCVVPQVRQKPHDRKSQQNELGKTADEDSWDETANQMRKEPGGGSVP